MRFTIGTVTQCAGGNHRYIPITVGAQTRTIMVERGDAAIEPGEAESRIRERIFSALKEGGAGMGLASWNTALSGKEFQI